MEGKDWGGPVVGLFLANLPHQKGVRFHQTHLPVAPKAQPGKKPVGLTQEPKGPQHLRLGRRFELEGQVPPMSEGRRFPLLVALHRPPPDPSGPLPGLLGAQPTGPKTRSGRSDRSIVALPATLRLVIDAPAGKEIGMS